MSDPKGTGNVYHTRVMVLFGERMVNRERLHEGTLAREDRLKERLQLLMLLLAARSFIPSFLGNLKESIA
jgi:hypothetical protein